MISSLSLYWITRLDQIQIFLSCIWGPALIFCLLIIVFGYFIYDASCNPEETLKQIINTFKISFIVFLLAAIPSVFIPSTKEMAFILLAPEVMNNKEVQKLPDNALKFLNKKLEAYINDLDGGK